MKKKPKILFISEKWCDASPAAGLTNNYHNMFTSLKNSGLDVPFNVIHFDECMIKHGRHIDTVLLNAVKKIKPDIMIFSLLGKSPLNPSMPYLREVKKLGPKLIFIWPDTGYDWGKPTIEMLEDIPDLNVSWDSDTVFEGNLPERYKFLWTPQDDKIYYKGDFEQQDIPISFIGSPRYEVRQKYLHFLMSNDVPVQIRGGQREESLTPIQYADLLRRSQMSLNFSESPGGFEQLKGRVFESISCGSLLFEKQNGITDRYFTPEVDYVSYKNYVDLLVKVKYFMDRPEERKKIIESAYKRYKEKYSAKQFWTILIESVLK